MCWPIGNNQQPPIFTTTVHHQAGSNTSLSTNDWKIAMLFAQTLTTGAAILSALALLATGSPAAFVSTAIFSLLSIKLFLPDIDLMPDTGNMFLWQDHYRRPTRNIITIAPPTIYPSPAPHTSFPEYRQTSQFMPMTPSFQTGYSQSSSYGEDRVPVGRESFLTSLYDGQNRNHSNRVPVGQEGSFETSYQTMQSSSTVDRVPVGRDDIEPSRTPLYDRVHVGEDE